MNMFWEPLFFIVSFSVMLPILIFLLVDDVVGYPNFVGPRRQVDCDGTKPLPVFSFHCSSFSSPLFFFDVIDGIDVMAMYSKAKYGWPKVLKY